MSEILSPDSSTKDSTKTAKSLTADDVNDLFNSSDNESKKVEESKESSKSSKESKGEEDELELIEPEEDVEKLDLSKSDEEDKDSSEEQSDELDIEAPPRKKEILKEYPELFKKFPFLEKMMYRDREYTELFGSFDDAREIAERSETFNELENQLLSGNTEEVLRSVKDADEKAFNIIVDDYLPTLAKVDKDAYFHVIGNLNKRLIIEMVKESNETGNEDLKQAALLVNQFVFGTSKFTAPTNRVDRSANNTEQNEIDEERASLARERFESSRDDLQTKVDNTLRATISDYIDPKGVMSSYVKKNAVTDAMKILSSAIASDPTVPKNLDKLWRVAFDSKFSKDSLSRIQSFYLSKAKGNLKNAILKARAEALKDSPARQSSQEQKEEEQEETPRRRGNITPGRPTQPKNSSGMRKGESVSEFFMRD